MSTAAPVPNARPHSPVARRWAVRAAGIALFAAGAAACAALAWRAVPSPPVSGPVAAAKPVLLGQLTPRQEVDGEVLLENLTGELLTVCGANATCGRGGCVELVTDLPTTAPAGGVVRLAVHYEAPPVSGPFRKEMPIFLMYRNELRETVAELTGTVAEREFTTVADGGTGADE